MSAAAQAIPLIWAQAEPLEPEETSTLLAARRGLKRAAPPLGRGAASGAPSGYRRCTGRWRGKWECEYGRRIERCGRKWTSKIQLDLSAFDPLSVNSAFDLCLIGDDALRFGLDRFVIQLARLEQ